jgi:hypothetical protein
MARHKNVDWKLPDGPMQNWEQVYTAVLMDIRDELQALNRKLDCPGVRATMLNHIPSAASSLRRIDKRLAKKVPLR